LDEEEGEAATAEGLAALLTFDNAPAVCLIFILSVLEDGGAGEQPAPAAAGEAGKEMEPVVGLGTCASEVTGGAKGFDGDEGAIGVGEGALAAAALTSTASPALACVAMAHCNDKRGVNDHRYVCIASLVSCPFSASLSRERETIIKDSGLARSIGIRRRWRLRSNEA